MRKRTIARISIASGTAALCLAVASPAMACVVPGADWVHQSSGATQLTPLALAISKADKQIAGELSQLDTWAAAIAADGNLTDGQKATFAGSIAADKTALQTQKSEVEAATTPDEVSAVMASTSVASAAAAVSLAVAVKRANDTIVGEEYYFTAFAAKVAGETDLTDPQKPDLAAKFATVQAQLQTERDAVDSATSAADVHTDLQSATVRSAINAVKLGLSIAQADNKITAAQAKLAAWATQAANDPGLSDAQKADEAAKIAAAQAALTTLKGQVDTATSSAQVDALMHAAHFDDQSWLACDPGMLPKLAPHPDQSKAKPSTGQPGADAVVMVKTQSKSGPNQTPNQTPTQKSGPSRADTQHHDQHDNGHGGHH